MMERQIAFYLALKGLHLHFLLALLFCGFAFGLSSCHSNQENKKPNIVLFYADDLGWMDLGIQGSSYYETPHIDRIAKEGMRFTNAYSNAANCAPSRACLMTGLYTPRHGIYTVGNADRGRSEHRRLIPVPNKTVLDTNLLTLPAFLKEEGYTTCMAGKWHLSDDPEAYGFDISFGGYKAGHPRSYFSPYHNPKLEDGPEGEHLPARLAREVSDWIQEQNGDPFFVYLPFYSVHTPIQAREDLIHKYQGKTPAKHHNKPQYAAMIEAMDEAVGQVLATLEEKGVAENTLVIFSSDNGAHGGQTLSRPLRGSKGMFYEGGIRVPFLVKWPGVCRAGSVSDIPVIGSDLFPTFVEMTGGRIDGELDGLSLMSILKGGELDDRALYWHFPAYLQSYRGDRAFDDSHDRPWFRTAPVSVIRDGDWKLLEYFEEGDTELYHLGKDPGETADLSETEPEIKAELHRRLKEWRKATAAPVPTQLNPDFETNQN